ncbi:LIM and SH3 domain protein Lasp [Galendromus occidentalis]|uniref:LIM and SH3 domain protein Lasp n=1 Tax=Galendromus occidentalis TaxID=34638 RepID=A0AAJ6VVY0_9ACAR|nr:LIM and SH3 domain protein Lasp [Galendromus occidentalis]
MQAASCCTSCRKIVYPTERLSVLNQIFHRSCFRCSSCRAPLSLRSFTTVEGIPFCVAHAPSLRPSPITDTPEMKLAARAQKLVSKNTYQKDFEQDIKGKVLTVAEDLETLRVKKNGAVISDNQYQGTLRRKRDMEAKRNASDVVRPHTVEFGTTALLYSAVDGRPVTFVGKSNQKPIGSIHDYDPYQGEEDKPMFTKTAYVAGSTTTNGWERVANLKNREDTHPSSDNNNYKSDRKPKARTGKMYRAVYTYRAQEADEVSFNDGDVLLGCSAVNAGWTTCTVLRNGKRGMVPANFIEPV